MKMARNVRVYSQYIKPNITATKPALMPAISLPPFAPPFFVLVGLAALPVPVGAEVDVAVALPVCWVCPTLGSATSPSTSHPPAVLDGQAGGELEGVYAESAMPVGVFVAHCDCKLVKSGATGVGTPPRENPPSIFVAVAVAATVGP